MCFYCTTLLLSSFVLCEIWKKNVSKLQALNFISFHCESCVSCVVVASEETRNFKLIERMEREREINEMKNFSVDFDFFASIFVTLSIKKSLLSQCVWQVLDFQISESSERVKTRVKFTINKKFFMFHISLHLGAIWKGFKESCNIISCFNGTEMITHNHNTESQSWRI